MLRSIILLMFLAMSAGHVSAQEEVIGPEAVRLTGEDLIIAFDGRRVDGMYYDDDYRQWYFYNEHYKVGGRVSGEGGPSHDRNKWWWRGNWIILEDRICLDYPDSGESYCREVWLDGDVYKLTTADGRVTEWHRQVD